MHIVSDFRCHVEGHALSSSCRKRVVEFKGGSRHLSGTRKEPKPTLLSPDIFRWGGGLPREGVGAKKFGMPLETREIKLFWRDIPGFRRDIPEAPEKFEKKKFGLNSRPLILVAPYRAILRYCCCDTPYREIIFHGG